VLFNRRGALWSAESDSIWYDGAVVNEGEFVKVSGAGSTQVNAEFQNRGEVRLDTGTLVVRGSSRHSGSFVVAPGAALQFGSSALHVAGPGSVIAGGGRFQTVDSAQFRAEARSVVDVPFTAGGTARFMPGSILEARDRTLRIEGALHLDTGAAVPVQSLQLLGNLLGSDTLEVATSALWSGGQMGGEGTTVILPGAELLLDGADRNLYRTLVNRGRALWISGSLYNNNAGVFRNEAGASLEIEANGLFSGGTLVNAGTLRRVRGVQSMEIHGRVENNGAATVESGTLAFLAGGAHQGRVTVSAGARFRIAGSHQFAAGTEIAGPGRFDQGGTTDFSGRYDLGGVTRVEGTLEFKPGAVVLLETRPLEVAGTLRLNSGNPVSAGSLSLAGTLAGSDTLRVTDSLDWTSGTMRDTGVTELAAGGSLTLRSFDRNLHRLLRVAGSGTWTAGTFYNNAAGRLLLEGSLELRGNAGFNAGVVEVAPGGSLVRTEGSGDAQFSQVLNSGTVQIDVGTVSLVGGMTNRGTLRIGAAGTLQLDRGVLSLQPGTLLDGSGTLRLYGSSRLDLGTDVALGGLGLLLEGSSTVSGDFELSNGPGGWMAIDHSLTFPGSLRIGGELRVLGASTVVTVRRVLTLLATGSIVNEGTLRAGRFDREDGSQYSGAPVVILGLPSLSAPPLIREIGFTSPGARARAASGPPEVIAVLAWEGDPGRARWYGIEISSDLQDWWLAWDADVEEVQPGFYRARVPGIAGDRLFFRVIQGAD